MKNIRGFASDNNSGVHDQVMQKMVEINQGHEIGYGDDKYTTEAKAKLKEHFGEQIDSYLVFNGTGANTLAIANSLFSFQAVICAATAHINVDECGAPDNYSGCKLLSVPTSDGKLTVEKIETFLHGRGDEHHVQPKMISLTEVSELGTIYTPAEIRLITDFAHERDMLVHMDGARLSNAAAALQLDLKNITTEAGIDILSFGLTKNGAMNAEAVIFFDQKLSENMKYHRKQAMQLGSKMRYMSAQFIALLSNDLWRENALHANQMAKLLADKIKQIPQIELIYPVQANGVFVKLPRAIIAPLQDEYFFYMWDEERCEARWMCSFDTTEEDVEKFVQLLKELLKKV
ncbi:MAG: low specificity L-threonine aldolase [Candidatus Cloacimonadales bacterium]